MKTGASYQQTVCPLHKTFQVIEPFLNKHSIFYHAPFIESGTPHSVWVINGRWNSGARLLMLKGCTIEGPGGMVFDLHDPAALDRLVRYLNTISC